MAVIVDNFESGVATTLDVSQMDDATLARWLSVPEALEEFVRRRYGGESRHLPGKHDQKTHGHGHAAAGRVQGRDLTDALDYGAANQQVQDWAIEGRYGDGALGHILAKQGFDGLPESGSSEDIDRLVADGHQELFRGWKDRPQQSAGEMQEQFRTGRLDPGYGVFGNGVYTAPNRSEAELYGSTQRMALHKDAKVVEYKSLIEEMSNRDDYDDSYSKNEVLQDPGRYAAAKGYDAIRYREAIDLGNHGFDEEFDYEEVVVLNRTALTVQKGPDLAPGTYDSRHLAGKHNQKTHGHGGGTAVADQPTKWQRREGEMPASGQKVVIYTNGSHTVMDVDSGFSREEIEDTVLPTLDRLMETNPVKGIVDVRLMPVIDHNGRQPLGLTVVGKGKIQLSGQAAGKYVGSDYVSEGAKVKASEYILVHEWGHAIDNGPPLRRVLLDAKFTGLQPSKYAKTSPTEAYAENFAKFYLSGGATSYGTTQAYAEEFGWKA